MSETNVTANDPTGNPLVVQAIDGEARIRDIGLAERLGFETPRMIRKLIKRHLPALDELGPRSTVERVINGGEATEFFLNRKQAIFITAKSETATATDITIEIIEKFEAYERGLIDTPPLDPMVILEDPAKLRHLLLTYNEMVIAHKAEIADLTPRAEGYERIAMADGSLCPTDAAKTLQVRPKDLFAHLSAQKWIYKRAGNGHWVGYQDKIQAGLLEHKVTEVTRSDGTTKITEQVRITPKGLARLSRELARAAA